MTLVKWTPLPMTVFNEVDNMINSVFNRDLNLEPIQSTKWNPAVDVKETDHSFLISADIPGLTKKDINIEVKEHILTIKGNRDKRREADAYVHKGISGRKFEKSFRLSEYTEVTGADLTDGILTVKLEVVLPEEKQPRTINIK